MNVVFVESTFKCFTILILLCQTFIFHETKCNMDHKRKMIYIHIRPRLHSMKYEFTEDNKTYLPYLFH